MGDVKLQGSELDPCRGKEPPSSLPQGMQLKYKHQQQRR